MLLPFFIFVLSICLITVKWWKQNKQKSIPGPLGIPILGNILQIGKRMPYKFCEWGEKYGGIFKVQLGSRDAVVISDPKMVKEIFTLEPSFAGRRGFEGFEGLFPNEGLGIVLSDGEHWEVHRRFLLRQLRAFGFGKSSMEQLIMDEVNDTLNHLKKLQTEKKSINELKQVLMITATNSLFSIVASKRWNHGDEQILKMMRSNEAIAQEFVDRFIFVLLPWTRKFLPEVKNGREGFREFYEMIVEEHKTTFDAENMRDFVDVYIAEMKRHENDPQSLFFGKQAEKQLMETMRDLYEAGSDTTSSTLTWAVLYLCTFKEVQEKLQKEISEITGDLRQIFLTDRSNMPYTLALIDEVYRYSSLVPTGVQHSALIDKEFKGYLIKKGTWLFPNLFFINQNKKIWGDPKNFRPERFLSNDGLKYQKNECLMPFGIGRRQCVGETLARDTIFLCLTNLFQKFEISFDPDGPKPTLEPRVSFLFQPQPYSIILKERV